MSLQDRLLAAHKDGDKVALVGLYSEAADAANDTEARCFFLTHAFIFALDAGDPREAAIAAQLTAEGRI